MTKEELIQLINIKLPDNNVKKITAQDVRECFQFVLENLGTAFTYNNSNRSNYTVGGVSVGSTFENIPLQDLLDWIFYGNKRGTDLEFKVVTTKPNEKVPIVLLRTYAEKTSAWINFGDRTEETITVEKYHGSEQWVDSEGNIHFIDNGNTYYHTYQNPGEYTVNVKASSNIGYIRLCESLTQGEGGYLTPSVNAHIVEISRFISDSLVNLDYTFAGLANATLPPDFKLETPDVETMNATFYGFGENKIFSHFPAKMLSEITKVKSLRGTFYRAGLRKILPGFFDSLINLESVWECFKNSALGYKHYEGIFKDDFIKYAEEGDTSKTDDFIPISLFWRCPKLSDISHVFNFIGKGDFGQDGGYPRPFILRRELFWNGKSVGNPTGTITMAFFAFAKVNKIIFEANLFKYAPNIEHLGGIFTQCHAMTHALQWWGMLNVAFTDKIVYKKDTGFSEHVYGNGFTSDLNVIFPENSYPSVKTLTGAFSLKEAGIKWGFNHDLDYSEQFNDKYKLSQKFWGEAFLKKFPNAKPGSVDARAKLILGQKGGSESDKEDGRNGAFYLLDRDERIIDKQQLPPLLFNNVIPF